MPAPTRDRLAEQPQCPGPQVDVRTLLARPIVFRGPGGATHQLAAQHFQCLESPYSYVPGLKVICPPPPRCVIVEEVWPFAGVGAEISYRLMQEAFDSLDAPIERVTSKDVPMPYAKNLEHAVLPDKERVVVAVRKVLYRR